MIGLLVLTSTLLHGSTIESRSPDELYKMGLAASQDAALARLFFAQAAIEYEARWERGERTPGLARNLAQAHLLAGDLAAAIRAYRRGLCFTPADRDLRTGLKDARSRVDYPANRTLATMAQSRFRPSLLDRVQPDILRTVVAVLYALGLVAGARGWMTRRRSLWFLAFMLLSLAGLMLMLVTWEEQWLSEVAKLPGVVVRSETPLQRGNGIDYPARIPDALPLGVELHLLAERGGWLQVQLADGTIGWVDARNVLRIE